MKELVVPFLHKVFEQQVRLLRCEVAEKLLSLYIHNTTINNIIQHSSTHTICYRSQCVCLVH